MLTSIASVSGKKRRKRLYSVGHSQTKGGVGSHGLNLAHIQAPGKRAGSRRIALDRGREPP
jgi:hypothetical protein